MKKLHVPALKEALVRALGLRGDVRLDLDGTIVPVMIAGTTLEVELATQVRIVNDLSDPAGVEFATPVPVTVANKPDVIVSNKPEVVIDDADPVRVQLTQAVHVNTYEDLSPFFYWRNLPTFEAGDDHYWTIGRRDSDDDDSHQFIWKDLIIRSENNDEDLDNWELCTFTSAATTSAGYTRDTLRNRSGVIPSANELPAVFHKYDATQPGAVGSILGPLHNLGAVLTEVEHPSDSITHVDMTRYWFSSGYREDNVWGIGLKRSEDRTPDITVAIGGLWLPKV